MQSTCTRRFLDVDDLASRQAVVAGLVEATAMKRLLEIATAPPRAISYRMVFARDATGRPRMTGRVEATVRLVCQRCLDEFDWCVDTSMDAVIVDAEHEETNARDAVVGADGRLMLDQVIEDELLLALPSAPVHPDGLCDAPRIRASCVQRGAERSHPFAALDELRAGQGRRQS